MGWWNTVPGWLRRALVASGARSGDGGGGQPRQAPSADPAWTGVDEVGRLDEHARQDIGLRDTRPVRRRLPWD